MESCLTFLKCLHANCFRHFQTDSGPFHGFDILHVFVGFASNSLTQL